MNEYKGYKIGENGIIYGKSGKPLKPYFNGNEYTVTLYYDECFHSITIKKLVATAYIPNPYGYKNIVHIDGNINNNSVSNLMWIDEHENHKSIAVYKLDKNGKVVHRYRSIAELGKALGLKHNEVRSLIKFKSKDEEGCYYQYT